MAIDTDKIIYGPTFDIVKDEAISEIKYYLGSGDNTSRYEQEYGDTPNWTIPRSGYTMKVVKSKRVPALPGGTTPCEIHVIASTKPGVSGGYFSTEDLGDKIIKGYTSTSLFIPAAWLGIRRATDYDFNADNKFAGSEYLHDIYDGKAGKGSYIFKNYDKKTSSSGSVNDDESEIDISDLDDDEKELIIDRKHAVEIYYVTYWTQKNIDKVATLTGTNGPFSSKYAPSVSVGNTWRVLMDDKVLVYDKDGTKFTKISRRFMKAPVLFDHLCKWTGLPNWARWE